MAKIPDSPEQIFDDFSQDVRRAFGAEVVSLALFGSGARGEYIPKKSDINFLVVLTQKGIADLKGGLELVHKWRKFNVSTPLFLTRQYIETALDTFPIEFLDMKTYHQQVYGEDILAGLQIKGEHLRHQIERELRGKLIYLRSGFLTAGNDRGNLLEMLSASVPAISSIFEGLLHLKSLPPAGSRKEAFEAAARAFKLNGDVFRNVMNIKRGEWRGSKVQVQDIATAYIAEMAKLVMIVDTM